jgi:hypothetical protein
MITFDLANFPLDEYADLIDWCTTNCPTKWEITFRYYQSLNINGDCDGIELPDTLQMHDDNDAMMCRLRFGFNSYCSAPDILL